MGHRGSHTKGSPRSASRGNRRTRGGPGRHNVGRVGPNGVHTGIRICLGCSRPFKSRGPWNRLCGRCHERDVVQDNTRRYRVPREWPTMRFRDADDS